MSLTDMLANDPSGVLFPAPPASTVDAATAIREAERRGRAGPAELIGAPDADGHVVVLDESTIGDGMWLRHLNALVASAGGPVAARTRDGFVTITWSDGVSTTILIGDREQPFVGHTDRIVRLPSVAGIPLLNGVPELAPLTAGFDPLGGHEVPAASEVLAAGIDLLQLVWPEAAADVARLTQGVVLLRPRDHARSHAPVEEPGLVLLTADSPEKVGDLLCHECSHVRLQRVLELDPLLHNLDEGGFRSPWRRDPRPLRGLLLGVHAFLSVVEWYRRLRAGPWGAPVWDEVIDRQARNVTEAWATLTEHAQPTPLGSVVLDVLGDAVGRTLEVVG